MRSIRRKIAGGALIFGCICAGMSAVSVISGRSGKEAVPAALIGEDHEFPVIILDAGHGGSS